MLGNTHYDQQCTPLNSGDRFFLFTDGLVEAPSPDGEQFGGQRLLEVLNGAPQAGLADLKSAVLRALRDHTGGLLNHDDVTLMAIEVR